MSVVISFGDWPDGSLYDAPDGSGSIERRGFRVSWARPLERHVLFALAFQIRLNGVEVEQKFMIRAVA